ncbi:Rrf2 family transcriptional regulator [Streptomyces sp. UNOC14_S4]|uniref:RrF2 family transcriptional regulator n=1 Tax=Streptomyces sp. UNOC14_S4 TaxID=2872340 RepID=UPI001E302E29|nr:Rrf2 family transcriptional regulator [Streptomyces sp. UNOC14_S4]MCC3766867.1 Rrf2 family transcriptional regulator [Streptomyces sp. UNOC14_S4]
MRISARTDYAVRAMAELARTEAVPTKAEHLAEAQDIPLRFLLSILRELRQHRLLHSVRGPDGGYFLARPAAEITLADVIRAVDGPLANVRDLQLSGLNYPGAAAALPDVWRAVRVSLRQVLECVTLADLAQGQLPPLVRGRAQEYADDVRYPSGPAAVG